MTILILGSEGFLGSHFVNFFKVENCVVFGVDLFEQPSQLYEYRKVSRLSFELEELFSSVQFDAVINAAGSANVPYSMTHPLMDFEANSLDTIRLLDCIRLHQPLCKYIHISSAAVYGNPAQLPVKEEHAVRPLSPYGWHKLISEHLCMEYTTIYKLRTAIIRPFSVYGPGLKKQLFWDLFKRTKQQGVLEIFGTGRESRDYIHVNDAVRAVNTILHKSALNGEIYNLASGIENTIEEVVNIYFNALGFNGEYRFNGNVRPGDPLNWRADVQKISDLDFRPLIKFEDGLRGVADWIKANNF